MNADSVASAVNSTTLTRPSTPAVPITPSAVILKVPLPPLAPIMSASALFTLSHTPIASSARYSTAVATIATKNSTNATAKENFITDHGSIRLTNSRARRGPRAAADETVARAARTASATRPVLPVEPRPRTAPVAVPAAPAPAITVGVARPVGGAVGGAGGAPA